MLSLEDIGFQLSFLLFLTQMTEMPPVNFNLSMHNFVVATIT